jgi:hypothetical protein
MDAHQLDAAPLLRLHQHHSTEPMFEAAASVTRNVLV